MKIIKALIVTLSLAALTGNFALAEENTQTAFSDVDVNTDYHASILWMASNSIINGNPDGTFKPDKCVNRAELLKMLYKILEVDTSQYQSTELFKDTPDGQWYSEFVKAGRARKTIQGYPDSSFKPDQCVKRVEAIKMSVLEFNNGTIPKYESYYGDLRDAYTSEWYFPYLHYALSANILGLSHIEQTDATGFKYFPADSMSRKEVAEMLYSLKTIQDNDLESYNEEYTPDAIVLSETTVNYVTDQLLLTSSDFMENYTKLEFDIYLERPDLGLQEDYEGKGELTGLSTDLNIALQPKLMYLSATDNHEKDSGSMCDRPRYPHRCEYTLSKEDLGKKEITLLIKTTFEDGTYAAKEISVPLPTAIEKPEILEPSSAPAQKSKLDMKFKDVGATAYEIRVDLCKPYGDDGINPCLDGKDFRISKVEDAWIFDSGNEAKTAFILAKDGNIQITDDLELNYKESVGYSVTAILQTNTSGIETLVYNGDLVSFQK